ncbi:hypothetical protein C5B42_02515 [Candidatus Cerribacteria bacterium 'Amazon FNV 2010 28 9']|uniref:Uncharacterized protein n=1 Tax=Candidatus Cerribacteria bacterium 'Amazon FNV 2010 28 9' TaxID=2081795 RepID=A0A317JQE0_9BACT|nr:MAG: hypothetical protein C5B42_02515 [Candidatus Cerribacteria bacterium 'Amazon FNV 2010 28 9']
MSTIVSGLFEVFGASFLVSAIVGLMTGNQKARRYIGIGFSVGAILCAEAQLPWWVGVLYVCSGLIGWRVFCYFTLWIERSNGKAHIHAEKRKTVLDETPQFVEQLVLSEKPKRHNLTREGESTFDMKE